MSDSVASAHDRWIDHHVGAESAGSELNSDRGTKVAQQRQEPPIGVGTGGILPLTDSAKSVHTVTYSCGGCANRWPGVSRCHCSGCHETVTEPACVGVDPAVFQADEPGYDEGLARATCAGCSIRAQCLERVLRMEGGANSKGRTGIWAGLTPAERARLARGRKLSGIAIPPPNLLTPEQHAARRKAHAEGLSDIQIGHLCGVTANTIRRWRIRNNLPTNNPEHSNFIGAHCATDGIRWEMWRAGATDADIARAVGVQPDAIAKWRHKRQLPTNTARVA